MRQTGYYWCKINEKDIWRPREWNGETWNVSGWYKSDAFMFAIHETRILGPDEKTRLIMPSDEEMIDFIDWFGTWQTDKNIDDYGLNDLLDSYREYHSRKSAPDTNTKEETR